MNTQLFSKEEIIGWLSRIASKMNVQSQSVFMVEGLQPSWLSLKRYQLLYGALVASFITLLYVAPSMVSHVMVDGWVEGESLFYGSLIWLVAAMALSIGCWSTLPRKNGVIVTVVIVLISGLLGGLAGGLILDDPSYIDGMVEGIFWGIIPGIVVGLIGGIGVGSLAQISTVESVSWNWRQFTRNTTLGFIGGGLIFGLIGGLVIGVFSSMPVALLGEGNDWRNWWSDYLIQIPTIMVWCGLITSVFGGLFGGVEAMVRPGKTLQMKESCYR